jgi:hypothetical protein
VYICTTSLPPQQVSVVFFLRFVRTSRNFLDTFKGNLGLCIKVTWAFASQYYACSSVSTPRLLNLLLILTAGDVKIFVEMTNFEEFYEKFEQELMPRLRTAAVAAISCDSQRLAQVSEPAQMVPPTRQTSSIFNSLSPDPPDGSVTPESRGKCGGCGQPVFITQNRNIDARTGKYFHALCNPSNDSDKPPTVADQDHGPISRSHSAM